MGCPKETESNSPWWILHASPVLSCSWCFVFPVCVGPVVRDTLGWAQAWQYCRCATLCSADTQLTFAVGSWEKGEEEKRRKKSPWAKAAGAHKKRPSAKFCVPDLMPDSQSFTKSLDTPPCWAELSSLLTFDHKYCVNLYIAVFRVCVLLIQESIRCGLDSHVLSHSFQKNVEKSECSQKSPSSLIFLFFNTI